MSQRVRFVTPPIGVPGRTKSNTGIGTAGLPSWISSIRYAETAALILFYLRNSEVMTLESWTPDSWWMEPSDRTWSLAAAVRQEAEHQALTDRLFFADADEQEVQILRNCLPDIRFRKADGRR